ncbi:MAG TPA: rhodanese-like domain-containing protein [Acidimicrobiia bacterium]|nr:rhodanese-like domain-containing protein [Acidimicrobiia bacterium]
MTLTKDETRQDARADVVVDPAWLEEHLDDPDLCLVEVDVSPAAYDEGHIDGAVLWNVYRDLKDTSYQLVDQAAIEQLVGRSGISPDSRVVFYGYAPAMGFWLMKLYGHTNVGILDCARETWRDQGRPWTTDVNTPIATRYPLRDEREQIRADHATVEHAIGDPTCAIVDVRTDAEFRGERFWPSGAPEPGGRAGHVPSAAHVSIDGLTDSSGAFRPAADLRRLFSSIDLTGDGAVISYCTIGGRACTAWFALTYLLGRQHVRVYDGSWAEWGRTPGKPVERGESR